MNTFAFTRPFFVLRWLCVLWCLSWFGACATTPEPSPFDSVIIAGDGADQTELLNGVSEELQPMFGRLQELVLARDDAAANEVLTQILALSPKGKSLEAAESYQRVLETVPSRLLPLFARLQEFVLDHDDEAARNTLARIYAQEPTGKTLEFAHSFERVLTGRALVSVVRLELVTQAHADDASRYRVALFVLNKSLQEFSLHPGAATLTLERTVVDGNGHERRSEFSSATDTLPTLALVPGEPIELQLQEFSRPVGLAAQAAGAGASLDHGLKSVMATRFRWHLGLQSSLFDVEGAEYPAMNFQIASTDRIWISSSLPQESVSSAQFAEAVHAGGLTRVELLRLAVRVPVEERTETLRLLASEVELLGRESLRGLAPCLRWISGDSRLGDDPVAWRAWIQRYAQSAAGTATKNAGLDLPDSE